MKQITEIEKLFDQMNAELAELKANYQKRGQQIFKLAFKEFFDSNPEVNVFGWKQFTPYFNDGETCEFSTDVSYAFVSNAKDYDNINCGDYEGEDESVWVNDENYGDVNEEMIPKSVLENAEIMRKFLSKVDDSVFLGMFGDHVQVFVTREGFDVQDFHHD